MKTLKKVAIIVAILIVAFVATFFIAFYWRGSTKPIEAEMNKFKPDVSWQLVDESFNPPKLACFSGECPHAQRVWLSDSAVDSSSLRMLIGDAGWHTHENICDNDTYNCFVTLQDSGYTIQISTDTNNSDKSKTKVVINMWKSKSR
jgi:hypothetical protein